MRIVNSEWIREFVTPDVIVVMGVVIMLFLYISIIFHVTGAGTEELVYFIKSIINLRGYLLIIAIAIFILLVIIYLLIL